MKEAILSLTMIWFVAFAVISADCSMKIEGNKITFQTPYVRFSFEGCALIGLNNKDTNESYIFDNSTKGRAVAFLMKNRSRIRLDDVPSKVEKIGDEAAKVTYLLENGTSMAVELRLDNRTGDVLISQYGKTLQKGVFGIEYSIGGINDAEANVIIPSRWNAGTMFTDESDYGDKLYRFPTFWEAQIVIVDSKKGGFAVFSNDLKGNFKALNVHHQPGSFALSFQTENNAPFDNLTEAKSVQWRVSVYTGDWRVPARRFRNWMEKSYNLTKIEERKPGWIRKIRFCVQPAEGVDFLKSLAKKVAPTCTLLYLPLWRKDGYDDNYPDYSAQEWVEDYIRKAHALGFRVMLHTNHFGVDPEHPLYEKFKKWQYRDAYTGELLWWHKSFAYIDPTASEWRKFFTEKVKEIIEKYHPDAIHLDQDHNAINNGIGPIDGMNAILGNMAFHDALADAMPQIAFSGECVNEITVKHNPFAQLAGLGGRIIDESTAGYVHPISVFLFSPYTTFYGHLGIASPQSQPEFWYAWKDLCERLGVIPTLRGVREDDLAQPSAALSDLLAEAQIYCQYQLTPSFETEQGSSVLLSLHGRESVSARFENEQGIRKFVLQIPNEEPSTISKRVSRVTELPLGSIPGWLAYDNHGAIGLAREKTYPYSDDKFKSSDFHISKLPKMGVITSQRRARNFFVFKIENRNAIYADLVKLLGRATTGHQYFGGKRHRFAGPIDFTASGAVCRREGVDKIWMHPPWRKNASDAKNKNIQGYGTGVTFAEYSLRLPHAKQLSLLGAIAMNPLRKGQSDGCNFIIKVTNDGMTRTVMERHYAEDGPLKFDIDMSDYAAKEILLELQVGPGPNYKPDWDWAFFIKPRIVVGETQPKIIEADSPQPIVALLDANDKAILSAPTKVGDMFRYSILSTLPNTFVFLIEAPGAIPEVVSIPCDLMAQERWDSFVGFNGIQRNIREEKILSVEEKNVSLQNAEKAAIVFQPKRGGTIYFDYLLTMPREAPMRLEVDVGLPSGLFPMVPTGFGSSYVVEVNGLKMMMTDWTQEGGWHYHTVDLSGYASKTILLTLTRYQKDVIMEDVWCAWGKPRILSESN